jgi:hypothetical protein
MRECFAPAAAGTANQMHSLLHILACLSALAAPQNPPDLSDSRLLDEVQRRAALFFWERSNPQTGLANDRAKNGGKDDYTVASTASTGYALAALPIAVERKWTTRKDAERRAILTLHFVLEKIPNEHGWLYHFIDGQTGERVWNSEVSTVDTSLLVIGALTCGQYFHGEAQQLANKLYDRLDWTWARTNGGAQPDKLVVSMGWTPEKGFIPSNWDSYCELMFIYLLGLGAKTNPLPPASWLAWKRPEYRYGGITTLAGGPIFMHQMAHAYYDFKDLRDPLDYDYWVSSANATRINRQFCIDNAPKRKTYGPQVWGLNASDGPDGYKAYGVPAPEDGTVSPTGALASILFTPDLSKAAAREMYSRFGCRIWGRYGFADSFNVDRGWYDPDVIGIDLGMVLLAIEDYRTGLVRKLMRSHPSSARALETARLHKTTEPAPRKLRLVPANRQ